MRLGRILEHYAGEQDAIVDEQLWEAVQRLLGENRVERKLGMQSKVPSLLAGILVDQTGDRMTPVGATKQGRRYRYYVSQALIQNVREVAPNSLRVAAEPVERAVGARLAAFLSDPASVHDALGTKRSGTHEQKRLIEKGKAVAATWATLPVAEQRRILIATQSHVTIGPESIELRLDADRLRCLLLDQAMSLEPAADTMGTSPMIRLSTAFTLGPFVPDTALVIESTSGGNRRGPDASLVRLLAQAQRYQAIFVRGGRSISEMAREMGVTRSYFTRILRLSFLAPSITRAIVLGRQPATLTASKLVADTRFPILWNDQRTALGFA